jgi:RNA polymerase sigma-70 factor (ECF subfamily)
MHSSSIYSGAERRVNTCFAYFGAERRTTPWQRAGLDDERTLVKRATTHDREAFARLYDRFVDRIYKYVYFKLGSRTEAEDVTAQVFLKAWEAIGAYQYTERPFASWLYRIAHNLVVDHFRARRDVTSIDELPGLEGRDPSLDEVIQQHMTADVLRRAMTRLTPDQQQVLLLRFIEGYSTEQVAHLMGKQPGAVRTLQHRALVGLGGVFRKGAERL